MSLSSSAPLFRSSLRLQVRTFSHTCLGRKELHDPSAISDFLSGSSWSVRSLLPNEQTPQTTTEEITSTRLRHLLRLSALPPPSSPEQEAKMLHDLQAQLHFVRQIQNVDTSDVKPLHAIRDESAAAQKENEMNLKTMKESLDQEEVVGKWHKRIRRRQREDPAAKKAEDWDVLGQAGKKVGKYFVVESERE